MYDTKCTANIHKRVVQYLNTMSVKKCHLIKNIEFKETLIERGRDLFT
jgi:hypothetical protein